jgi:hypothetical protein
MNTPFAAFPPLFGIYLVYHILCILSKTVCRRFGIPVLPIDLQSTVWYADAVPVSFTARRASKDAFQTFFRNNT